MCQAINPAPCDLFPPRASYAPPWVIHELVPLPGLRHIKGDIASEHEAGKLKGSVMPQKKVAKSSAPSADVTIDPATPLQRANALLCGVSDGHATIRPRGDNAFPHWSPNASATKE